MRSRRLTTGAIALLLFSQPFAASAWAAPSSDGAAAHEHPSELESDRVPAFTTGGSCLIRGATIHTAIEPAFVGDVLVQDGKISAVGTDLENPGVHEIDGTGRHLAPGVIDTHSHMAIERGINEGTLSITADVNISDSINADDVGIWRALAGGTTTIQCLHGSANAIGGRSEVLKLKWGRTADELRFEGAPQGIKFALGENPKRSNWGSGGRYPATRMGVESIFRRGFERAREYDREQAAYAAALERGEDACPPRPDLRLSVLSGILSGEIDVHSHCYRADEILMLLRTAEDYGFQIKTLQHVLEGYKVAPEIAAHGAGASTFSDWWAYKIEAYDAIPTNAALMDEAGVLASINSDSGELVRHLYQEAGKSVRYAGMDRVRALALVTLNAAIQLGIEDRVGSIEVGKDADLVLMTGDPLLFTSRVECTLVEGEVEFTRLDAFGLDTDPPGVRELVENPVIEASFQATGGPVLAITGGTLHPVTSEAIENGTLIVQDGRIVALGADLELPAGARILDATGQHVWPGMIALGTTLGLHEIGAVSATNDNSEIGGNQPDLRVTASIHADSAHIPVTRLNGVTRSQTAPSGRGPIRGQSSVVRLTGDTWEEMLTVDRDMLHVSFPRVANDSKKKDDESDRMKALKELLEEAREYGRIADEVAASGGEPPAFDPRLAALVPYVRGEKRVALHASNAQSLLFALRFAEGEELDAVIFGAGEGWKVADALAEAGLPVVLSNSLAVPRSRFDPYDSAYANAAVLSRAGVDIALSETSQDNTRNLPHEAAMAIAFGLPHEEALRGVTLYPARVLGLDEQLGSLEPGKIADVVITEGDLFDNTSAVTSVLIDGEPMEMADRQTRLYDRYRERVLEAQQR